MQPCISEEKLRRARLVSLEAQRFPSNIEVYGSLKRIRTFAFKLIYV
jgi:hypothetical protein